MLDMLETYLRDNADASLASDITRALELFDEYGLQDYEVGYSDLLLTLDNSDLSGGMPAITELTRQYQDDVLSQLQIQLSEDTTVGNANRVLEVIRLLENTEFAADISVLCQESHDPDETLCEIIGILTGLPPENFYEVVQFVDPSLIVMIKSVCDKQMDDVRPAENREATVAAINKLRRFKSFCEDYDLVIYRKIIEFTPPLLPFSIYYDLIIEDINEMGPKFKAMELFGAFIISEDAGKDAKDLIVEHLNKTYSALDKITPVLSELTDLILKFNAEENSGVKRVEG